MVPEDEELSRQPSLDWDKYGENAPLQIVRPLDNTRTWSTDTLFSAPIASSSALDGSESSDSENYLSPDAEEGSVLADEVLAEEDDNMATDAATMRRKVSRAILEAEEDVLPFSGKRVTLNCISRLCIMATSLKKDLQVAHLDLVDDEQYQAQLAEAAKECRQKLSTFLVEAE